MGLLDAVKQELQWDNGIQIPLANSSNKQLEVEIQEKIKEIAALQSAIDVQKQHISAITQHLALVQEQLHERQNLCQAKERENESENVLQSLMSVEEKRLLQDTRRAQHELENIKEKKALHEKTRSKLQDKIKVIQEGIHWDKLAIESWLEDAILKDDDAMLLQACMHDDASKIKELELKLEKLTLEEQQKQKALSKAETELRLSQVNAINMLRMCPQPTDAFAASQENIISGALEKTMELDKTSEDFKAAHHDRQNCIRQWEIAVKQMQSRDEEIESYIQEIIKIKDQLHDALQQKIDKQQSLDKLMDTNNQMRKNITAGEKAIIKLGEEKMAADATLKNLHNERDMLKSLVSNSDMEFTKIQTENQQLEKTIEECNAKVQSEKEIVKTLASELDHRSEVVLSVEDQIHQMDELIQQEHSELQTLRKEVTKLQRLKSEESQALSKTALEEKKLSVDLQGLQSLDQKLTKQITKMDGELQSKDKILLSQEEEISILREKLHMQQGSDPSQQELSVKIDLIQQVLTAKKSGCQALLQETKQQQSELRLAQKELETAVKTKTTLESKLKEVILHNDVADKMLKDMVFKKQKLLVSENVLKLEVKRLQNIINDKSTNLVSLEKQRLSLETMIRERKQEIEIEKETLKTEIRLMDEGRQRIAFELNDCMLKTEKLKKRCEIMMIPWNSWKTDHEISPVHFLIKMAEDKDSLKRETTDMQNKLQKAEKDLQVFQTTAKLMKEKNQCLRKNLNSHGENVLSTEKFNLEKQFQKVSNILDTKKKRCANLHKNLMVRESDLEKLMDEENILKTLLQEKHQLINNLKGTIQDQEIKLNRVTQTLQKLNQEIEKDANWIALREDVQLRLIREQNKTTVSQIGNVMVRHPEITSVVERHFRQANLPLPRASSNHLRRHSATSPGSTSGESLPSLTGSPGGTSKSASSGKRSSCSAISLPAVVNITMDHSKPNSSIVKCSIKSPTRRGKLTTCQK